MKRHFLSLCIIFHVYSSAYCVSFTESLRTGFGIFKPKPVTPQLIQLPILSGPYQGKDLIVKDILVSSPTQELFDFAESHPEIVQYVDLIARRTCRPVLISELVKYRNFQTISNPHYKQEALFMGRFFLGILVNPLLHQRTKVCVHENWLQPKDK